MSSLRVAASVLLGTLVASACGPKVMVPPRLDLAQYYQVGLVGFTAENAKGSLHEVASARFAAQVFASQAGIEILELGSAQDVLTEIGARSLDSRAARAIGDAFGVPVVFFGHLKVSNIKPRGGVIGFPHVEAVVSVDMTVRLLSTESGGTLWSNSARATERVGELGFDGDDVYFGAEDPDDAYGHLVDHLIFELTRDLRPTFVRQDD